jgi:hypothetical protein
MVLIICLFAWDSASHAIAEPPPDEQNPLLVELARVDRGKWEAAVKELQMLATAARASNQRKGVGPTDREASQIVANRAFSRAFAQDRIATLLLLREINDDLDKKRGAQRQ